MNTAICTMCGVEKPLAEFFRDRTRPNGHNSHCKQCDYLILRPSRATPEYRARRKAYNREYYARNPECQRKYRDTPEYREKEAAYRRQYLAGRRANDPKYREWKAAHDKRYRQTLAGKITMAKAKAKRRARGSRFNLDPDAWSKILQAFGHACAYCESPESLTIDHFIPLAKGGHTVVGNIVPACHHCNSSKQAKMPQNWCTEDQLRRVLGILSKP